MYAREGDFPRAPFFIHAGRINIPAYAEIQSVVRRNIVKADTGKKYWKAKIKHWKLDINIGKKNFSNIVQSCLTDRKEMRKSLHKTTCRREIGEAPGDCHRKNDAQEADRRRDAGMEHRGKGSHGRGAPKGGGGKGLVFCRTFF